MSNQILKYKSNVQKTIIYSLQQPVKGGNGTGIGLREIVVNGLDAGASQIAIWLGTHQKEKALFIADDGRGMGQDDLQSVINYGYSSKLKSQKMIGVHGTGSKLLLGIGTEKGIWNNRLTYISRSSDYPHGVMATTNLEHLIKGAQKGAKAEIKVLKRQPNNWQFGFTTRDYGTTVIFTGFDGRKVWSAQQIIKELGNGSYITPAAASKVKVLDTSGKKAIWRTLRPNPLGEEYYQIGFQTKSLGTVTYGIYLDGSSWEDLLVCGLHNVMEPLQGIYRKLSPTQKKRVPRTATKLSGHIVFERTKHVRDHDSTLNDHFYEVAIDEFLDTLDLVCEEVEAKRKQIEDQEHQQKHRVYARKLVYLSQQQSGTPQLPDGVDPNQLTTAGKQLTKRSSPIRIFPSSKRLKVNSTVRLRVQSGIKGCDDEKTTWTIQNPNLITLHQDTGACITGTANNIVGSTYLTLSNPGFPEREIRIKMTTYLPGEPVLSIHGPHTIYPDTLSTYRLHHHEGVPEANIRWSIAYPKKKLRGISLEKEGAKLTVLTSPDCETGTFYLIAKDKRRELARRKVELTESDNKPLILSVNQQPYLLNVGSTYPVTFFCEQVDDQSDLGVIHYNPMTEYARQSGSPVDKLIHGIGQVALTRQYEEKKIPSLSLTWKLLEKFIVEMKKAWFPGKNK